jgi:preprotein translocase subunit SecG
MILNSDLELIQDLQHLLAFTVLLQSAHSDGELIHTTHTIATCQSIVLGSILTKITHSSVTLMFAVNLTRVKFNLHHSNKYQLKLQYNRTSQYDVWYRYNNVG